VNDTTTLESQLASAHEQLLLAEADRETLATAIRAYMTANTYGDRGHRLGQLKDLLRAEHPGQALADEVTRARSIAQAAQAERQGLLVVAYEAYKLSMQIGEFDTVVDDHDVDALDRALLKAFNIDQLNAFAEVGERITIALGGYAAMLKARQP
jgi:hypothetical protein